MKCETEGSANHGTDGNADILGKFILKVKYFARVGANTLAEVTGNVMTTAMTSDLACKVNWSGVNDRYRIAETPFAGAIVGDTLIS